MTEMKELLKPTNDYVFCRLFGYKGNENITKAFLEAITKDKYDSIKVENQARTIRDFRSDKIGILDIKAESKTHVFNIEMQVVKYEDMPDRVLWYWSKLYSSDIKKSEKYSDTRKVISILIADYNLAVLKNVNRYHSSWHIREDEMSTIVLTPKFELHIIELNKLGVNINKQGDTKLRQWLESIRNPNHREELCMNEEIEKARRVLEEISQDEEERELAEQREIWQIDHNSFIDSATRKGMEKGIAEGMEKGMAEGIAKGIAKGEYENRKKTAKKMLGEGFDIETIKRITELSESEIETLKD